MRTICTLNSKFEGLVLPNIYPDMLKKATEINMANNWPGDVVLEGYNDNNNMPYMDISTSPKKKNIYSVKELHPTNLGPIHHPHPHLPSAQTLHNYWCANMVYINDIKYDTLTDKFYDRQYKLYTTKVPHQVYADPLWWVWVTYDGLIKKYNLLQARQFFCIYYERLVRNTDQYKQLEILIKNGMNIKIRGGNVYSSNKSIEYHYLFRNFGHDMILYAMLMLPSHALPWNKNKTEIF